MSRSASRLGVGLPPGPGPVPGFDDGGPLRRGDRDRRGAGQQTASEAEPQDFTRRHMAAAGEALFDLARMGGVVAADAVDAPHREHHVGAGDGHAHARHLERLARPLGLGGHGTADHRAGGHHQQRDQPDAHHRHADRLRQPRRRRDHRLVPLQHGQPRHLQ